MAVLILAIAGAAVIVSIGESALISGFHNRQATAGAVVRDYAEAIEQAIATNSAVAPPAAYVSCATIGTYLPSNVQFTSANGYKSGYSATITAVTYWNGSAFVPASQGNPCVIGVTDTGAQKLSLKVDSPDGRVSESLDLVLRMPCRPADSLCS
jgi:hypothetical protein